MQIDDIRNILQTVIIGEPPEFEYIHYIDVGNYEFVKVFEEEVLDNLILQGGATCRFFEGPYGSGKSHLLQILCGLGLKKDMLISQIELSKAESLRDWHTTTSFILENLEMRVDGETIKGLPYILETVGRHNKIDSACLRSLKFSHPGFANAMMEVIKASFSHERQRELLFEFLCGKRVGAMKMREVGLKGIKNPLTRRNAEQVLNTVLSVLYSLGRPVMLIIDENETSLGYRNTWRNQMAANLIRRLVDACQMSTIVGTVIIFTVLPGFIANCAQTYQAVGERLLLPRLQGTQPGWRWPVLSIEHISAINDRLKFIEECAIKFEQLVNLSGANTLGLKDRLIKAGNDVIQRNAGISFRRELIKRFASIASERVK